MLTFHYKMNGSPGNIIGTIIFRKILLKTIHVLTNCEIPFESELTYWTKIKRINENNFTKTTEYK